MFIKKYLLNCFEYSVVSSSLDGILGVILKSKHTDLQILIVSCYLPPEESVWGRDSNTFFSHLLSLIYLHSECDHVFICGDINARIGNMNDFLTTVDTISDRIIMDNVKNAHGESLIDFLLESKMVVLNGRVTPEFDNFTSVSVKGRAVVDYILSPQSSVECVRELSVLLVKDLVQIYDLSRLLSERCKCPDNSVIKCTINILSVYNNEHEGVDNQNTSSPGNNSIPHSSKRYKFKDIPENFMNNPNFKEKLENLIAEVERCENEQQSMNKLYDDFCSEVFKEMDAFLRYTDSSKKTRKKFKYFKPYWNDDLTCLWQNMREAEKQFLKCKTNNETRQRLHTNFKFKQKIFDKSLQKASRTYYRHIAENVEEIKTSNPKEFWKQIKKLGPSNKKNIPMKVYNDDGSENYNYEDIMKKWSEDFSGVLNRPIGEHDSFDNAFYNEILHALNEKETTMSNNDNSETLNSDMSVDEILIVINKLKSGKSCGPDFIPNEILKQPKLVTMIHKLFQFCFENRIVPDIWKKAVIVPIPKGASKDPHVPLNYRGISLLNCVAKVYSAIINNRIMNYCENNSIIAEEQNGFRPKRSCLEHVYSLTSIIRNKIGENKSVFIAFVDFHKAFDWVDRSLLLYKLLHFYNIQGNIYWAIKTLYNGTAACIRLNETYSEWFNTTSGVKQGDNLSPTLFSLFINDFVLELKNLRCGVKFDENDMLSILLYADDIVLSAESEHDLQEMLNCLYNWCHRWRLVVNESKTQIMHMRPPRYQRTQHSFKFGDKNLEIVQSYKYLGICINEHLEYKHTAAMLAEAGSRALGALRNKIYNLKDIMIGAFTTLFNAGITPILDYCAGVWGMGNFKCIEDVQLKAARYYLGVHKFCPLLAIEGEIGWVRCATRRKLDVIKLWNKIVTLDDLRIPKRVLNHDIKMSHTIGNWVSDFSNLLQTLQLNTDLESFQQIDIDTAKNRLLLAQFNNWNDQRSQKIKLRNYNLFKSDMAAEAYVIMNMSKQIRSCYAQFRTGILPIMVEIGRFHSIPLEERYCPLCKDKNMYFVEDEFHLLCICQSYQEVRNELYIKALATCSSFVNMDDFEKFLFLNCNLQVDTAKCVYKIIKIRESQLYSVLS